MVSEIRCWIRTHPWGRQSHQAVAPLPSPSLPTHLQVEGLILGLSILSAKGWSKGLGESTLAKLRHPAAHLTTHCMRWHQTRRACLCWLLWSKWRRRLAGADDKYMRQMRINKSFSEPLHSFNGGIILWWIGLFGDV